MDTSETYIKMCEKAVEIQEHLFEEADYCYNGFYRGVWDEAVPSNTLTWLPRQDQLQEIVGEFNLLQFWQAFFIRLDYVIQIETGFEVPKWAIFCDSWEQLWLAFVMLKKHNKEWDGVRWS